MEIIRNIVKSNIEPEFKEVGWLDTSTNPPKLKFFTSDSWKEIDSTPEIDKKQDSKSFSLYINRCSNYKNDNNTIEVKINKKLPEDYKIALFRKKKTSYYNREIERKRYKGVGYRLFSVYGSVSNYRERSKFIDSIKFIYNDKKDIFILKDNKDKEVSIFDVAYHFTEMREDFLRVSSSGSFSRRIPKYTQENKIVKVSIPFGIGIVKYKGKDESSGYIVCSNIAKVVVSFCNYDFNNMEGIDITTEEGLKRGFSVHVIN